MVSHVFAFCLKVSTSVKVNFRTAGIFLGYLVATSNKHFQAIIHMIQNCHSGKQKTRWEKTNKGNYHSVSLGPGSASGGKRRKKLAWAKTKIGEQSEPRGSLLRGKGWRRLRHPFPLPRQPLGSLRSPIFFLFNPVFCLPPPPCGSWSHATIQSKDVCLCFPTYRFCATWLCKGPIFFSHLTIRTYPRATHSYFILLLTISYFTFFTRFFAMCLLLVT